mgnify:CR=1 FL=1
MCSIVRDELVKDQRLLKLHKNRIDEDCYYDNNYNLLTQDFIYAATYHDSLFYFLGVDTSRKDILIQTDYNYNVLFTEQIEDNIVVGLDFRYGNLHLSYRDRRIELSGIEFD